MRRTNLNAPLAGAPLVGALALCACLGAAGAAPLAMADETTEQTAAQEESQDTAATDAAASTADAADATAQDGAGAATAQQATTGNASTVAATGLAVKSYSTDMASADPAMAELNAQNTLVVHAQLTNETSRVSALYDALNQLRTANGLSEFALDGELEGAAYQRAAESYLAHSDVRPDATLFTTACGRSTAEVLVWGNSADDTSAQAVLDKLASNDYATAYSWLLNATNLGIGCVSDSDGNVYWAIEVSYDGASASDSSVADGGCDYSINAAAANVAGIALPERLEMKSGQTQSVEIDATVQGTLYFGVSDYGYSYEFTGGKVTVDPSNFIWNSANTKIVSVTKDGTLTAVAAGTVTISTTDADGSNPRFGAVVVDGGSKSSTYDLADCTLVGLTGDDGRGNLYLNSDGGVNMPTFSVVAGDGTVIDSVNYTATISYNATTSIAVLSVKANSKSEVCSGITTCKFSVIDPNAQTASEQAEGTDGAQATASDDGNGTADGQATEASSEDGTGEATQAQAEGDGQEDSDAEGTAETTDELADGSGADASQQQVDGSASEQPEGESSTDATSQGEESGQADADSQEDGSAKTSIAQGQLTLSFSSLAYTGSPIVASSVTLTVDGVQLVEGTDFTLSYEDNVNVGTARAVATGIGAYEGTLVTTYGISQAAVSQDITQTADPTDLAAGAGLAAAGLGALGAGLALLARARRHSNESGR